MSQISFSALLFDLDGVLVDSTPAVERVWRQWAVEHGFDPADVVLQAHGRPSLATIREYLPEADHEAENRKVEKAEIEDLGGVIALPGALKLLNSLPPERWTIVTSCTRPLAEVRIRAAGLPVPKEFVTATDISNGKPHPEPYLKGASKLGVAADRCLVVEDVPAGIRAGKSAGMQVAALRTTLDDHVVREAGADWVLDNCGSLSFEGSSGDGILISIRE
jgi:mannitol-1-/sugar-/sorbitol-6-phosphatase